jgi:hypothetical protein
MDDMPSNVLAAMDALRESLRKIEELYGVVINGELQISNEDDEYDIRL